MTRAGETMAGTTEVSPGYSPGRTLPLRVEVVR